MNAVLSGNRQTHIDKAIAMVEESEGSTGAEIAKKHGVCAPALINTLADIDGVYVNSGKKRTCDVTNHRAVTWWVR